MAGQAFDPIQLGPITITFLVDAEMSNGSATASRCDVVAGAGIPLPHSHDAFEETIIGLEGVTTFTVDGEEVEVGPGETLCIKRGQVHKFAASADADVSFIGIATPGLFGPEYFIEIAEVFKAAGDGPPDPAAMVEVMLRHGLTPRPEVVA